MQLIIFHAVFTGAMTKSGVNTKSLGIKTKQNVVQKDVMNNIFNSEFVNVKESEFSDGDARMQLLTQDGEAKNPDVLCKTFIVKFKQKRRRALLEKLRNLRGKEKIRCCAIILSQLDRLKCDIGKLSNTKPRGKNALYKDVKTSENSNNIQFQNIQRNDNAFPVSSVVQEIIVDGVNSPNSTDSTTREMTTASCDLAAPSIITKNIRRRNTSGKSSVVDGSDYNVMSMETSDSEQSVFENRYDDRKSSAWDQIRGMHHVLSNR